MISFNNKLVKNFGNVNSIAIMKKAILPIGVILAYDIFPGLPNPCVGQV